MNLEKAMILIFLGAVAFLYYKKPGGILSQSIPEVQASAPWFLLYNYPVGFTGYTTPPLPSRSFGEANAQTTDTSTCLGCSIIPITNTAQY